MLLMIPCVSISQTTDLQINPGQVKNVYIGLKQGEVYKSRLADCISVANELNTKIQAQNDSIQKSVLATKLLLVENNELNEKYTKQSVEVQRLQNRKTPWYRHPITYTIIGFAGGVYLMKN